MSSVKPETLCSQGGYSLRGRMAYGLGTLEKDQRCPIRTDKHRKEALSSSRAGAPFVPWVIMEGSRRECDVS